MINQVTLIGNLGADPEVRSTNAGDKVTNIRVATTETWKGSDGERREKTEWHRVTIWGEPSAKYLAYAKKGHKVYVQGKLTTRKWEDQQGIERYSTEIVVNEINGVKILEAKEREEQQPQTQARRSRTSSRTQQQPREDFSANLDDEIPF